MGRRHLSEIELTEYVDGETPAAKAGATADHLRQCTRCAAALAALRDAIAAVGDVRAVAPPENLARRVVANFPAESIPRLTCRQVRPLLHEHIDGQLSPVMVAAIQRHVRGCSPCRAEFVALSTAMRLVRSLGLVAPPARVRDAVWAAPRGQPIQVPWGARVRPVLRPAFVAAGVLAAGGLLFLLRVTSHQVDTASPPALVARAPASAADQPSPSGEPSVAVRADHMEMASRPAILAEPSTRRTTAKTEPTPKEARPRVRPPVVTTAAAPLLPAAPPMARPDVSLPSAVQTLKEIARAAADDRAAQRAMNMAGERFAILDSETALATLPEGTAPSPAGTANTENGLPGVTTGPGEGSGETTLPESDSTASRADSLAYHVPLV